MVGDRLWLTVLVSFVTIIFTWLIAFPIGIYSATHQYSWGDYGLTFLGLLGLAIPNFLLALILMYFANIWFGISIGHLMDPQYLQRADELGEGRSRSCRICGSRSSSSAPAGTAGMIRRLRANLLDELQKQYVITARAKGLHPFKALVQISAAHVAQLLHLRYRLDPAGDHLRRRDHRHRAVAGDHRADADQGAARARTCISPARS